ncbi:hypothetical protein A5893_05880 [Pedobacter psychrophilus]|uniref:Porin n=1 Tax=Pedobacter psychrophilus TaxID=1826909 RepID=A0A179DHE4_9SPHI|nr:hypothetical protein [Pedobacter psychrophilus]OAQ40475.1 hypothetical protein A5893_05880 [Pedobacter psychrophilus]
MNTKKLSFIILSFLTIINLKVKSQTIEANLNYFGFMDNREYARSFRYSQTIFGNRISPEVGLKLDSFNRFRIGFNALYEFGSQKNTFIDKIDPVIYYEHEKNNWQFFIGSFPRLNLVDNYPRGLIRDTLNYYRPNIEGMLVKYQTKKFKETVWLDWTSRQTANDKETFLFGFSGKYQPGIFFLSHYAFMFHNAGAGIPIPGDFLQDNGGLQAEIGMDLSRKTFLDSLTLSGGVMFSIERTRAISSSFDTPAGFVSNLYASYRKFSVQNTFYAGEGHHIIYGDSFYTSKSYDRIDLGYTPIKYKNLEGKFVFSYHIVDGALDNQQAFFLRYNISGKKDIRKKQ